MNILSKIYDRKQMFTRGGVASVRELVSLLQEVNTIQPYGDSTFTERCIPVSSKYGDGYLFVSLHGRCATDLSAKTEGRIQIEFLYPDAIFGGDVFDTEEYPDFALTNINTGLSGSSQAKANAILKRNDIKVDYSRDAVMLYNANKAVSLSGLSSVSDSCLRRKFVRDAQSRRVNEQQWDDEDLYEVSLGRGKKFEVYASSKEGAIDDVIEYAVSNSAITPISLDELEDIALRDRVWGRRLDNCGDQDTYETFLREFGAEKYFEGRDGNYYDIKPRAKRIGTY